MTRQPALDFAMAQPDGASQSAACPRCHFRQMWPQRPAGWQWFSFRQTYCCGRCGERRNRLAFTWRIPAALAVLASFAVGGVYVNDHAADWLPGRFGGGAVQSLARARAATGGQLSPFEEMMVRRPKLTMVNSNIVELTKAGVRPDVIVRLIRASSADYDLRANSVIDLKRASVAEAVIVAMIDQSFNSR